ncbi:MAG: 5-deoxy-glucuronate isomerase [Alphaproteobacteria bacterium]|nr:MAG: 5-deoxy-glucuronate isomerase [Alphaproteobacteria bacterium]
MTSLLRRPVGTTGKVHDITPESAGWAHVGFALYRLAPGEDATAREDDRETVLVLVEGRARIEVEGEDFGEVGGRMDVFERTPPSAIYVPPGTSWIARATTPLALAVCTGPGRGTYPPRLLGPDGIETVTRGKGANTRFIHNIAMEDRDVAGSLLVTEVFTPDGNWSSYPPHRHDEADFPNITLLEETYYHRLNPPQGFGFQRVYTEDGTLDETMAFADGDVVLVPRGHHPVGVPYGYESYYLNVMAGPLRKWRFQNDPAHDWIFRRDQKD